MRTLHGREYQDRLQMIALFRKSIQIIRPVLVLIASFVCMGVYSFSCSIECPCEFDLPCFDPMALQHDLR